jgi:hypothetical protein
MKLVLLIAAAALAASGQTADELVRKNIAAHGGIDKIRSVHSYRLTGRMQAGSFTAEIGKEALAPNMLRQTVTIQGMTEIESYDGSSGWKISPFEGRKDPELMGEDDLRGLMENADFYGPLVDYQQKGNKIEYLGHDTVDGDDALKLKVTLKNGDLIYYYLDPETFLEIRIENIRYIRGAIQESFKEPGSYKQSGGVYFPFSYEMGSKQNPVNTTKLTIDKIEVNVPLEKSLFQMPESKGAPAK